MSLVVDILAASKATTVPAATLRTWAARGLIARHGTDAAGRTLYDVDEVLAHVATTGWKARPPRRRRGA